MLDRIIRIALKHRILILAGIIILVIAGVLSVKNANLDVFPDLNAPTVVIMTEANGMAPEEVEQLVTFPVETAINGAAGIRRVRSSSTTGFSVVWAEFDWGTDTYRARQVVTEKLTVISESLPANVGRPTLAPQSSILGEILIVSLTSNGETSMSDLRTFADKTLRPRLLSIGGVAQVAVLGGDIKEYQILPDPFRMKHYDVSLNEILEVTRGMNQNTNGGVIYDYGNEYLVRGMLASSDTTLIGKGVVRSTPTAPILLEDVASVGVGAKLPKLGVASERGEPAVLLTVTKQPDGNTLDLTRLLEETIEEMKPQLPAGVNVSTDIFKQSKFIESAIKNVERSLLEGAFFVIIILFLFLGNIRTTVISLVTLPVSLSITLLVLHLLGYGINTMILGGMAIAIGSLVDDAIVDVENVLRRLRMNRALPKEERLSMLELVYEASREVRMPIFNSTLIIAVSFVPLFFLTGMEGRMLFPLGLAFIVSLFASTLVALTLTPVLCTYLLGGRAAKKEYREPKFVLGIRRVYDKMLSWAMAHSRVTVGSTLLLLVVAIVSFFTLGRSFLLPFNEGSFTVNISALPGISLDESDRIGRRAEEILLTIPEIQTVARKTGRAELDEHALGVNDSEIEAPFELKDRSRKELLADVRGKLGELTGVNIEIGQPISHRIDGMLSGTKANIAIKLFGPDLNRLFNIGQRIQHSIEDVEGITDLNVEQQTERPQLQIVPRREMLASYGISLPTFANFVEVALAGETVSQVFEDGRIYDLTVRLSPDDRDHAEKIANLTIDTQDGRKVPLSYVADVVSSTGPNTINREHLERKVVVSANVTGGDLRGAVEEIKKKIEENVIIPEGYHVEYGGQFENEQQASRILMIASIISIAVIFLLLFLQFNSWQEAGIILLNLPFALIGGVFILLFTSGEVSIPAIIGFISLFGIATRNGMLLIDRYKVLELEQPEQSISARVRNGSANRLNAILMTALTSALALLPMALSGEQPGNEIQRPMAQVILGGLLTSTLLNAFIIPSVYVEFARWRRRRQERLTDRNTTEQL